MSARSFNSEENVVDVIRTERKKTRDNPVLFI